MTDKIKIHLDPFLTDTRVKACVNTDCPFNTTAIGGDSFDCRLKQIEIDENGKCMFMKKKRKE